MSIIDSVLWLCVSVCVCVYVYACERECECVLGLEYNSLYFFILGRMRAPTPSPSLRYNPTFYLPMTSCFLFTIYYIYFLFFWKPSFHESPSPPWLCPLHPLHTTSIEISSYNEDSAQHRQRSNINDDDHIVYLHPYEGCSMLDIQTLLCCK